MLNKICMHCEERGHLCVRYRERFVYVLIIRSLGIMRLLEKLSESIFPCIWGKESSDFV